MTSIGMSMWAVCAQHACGSLSKFFMVFMIPGGQLAGLILFDVLSIDLFGGHHILFLVTFFICSDFVIFLLLLLFAQIMLLGRRHHKLKNNGARKIKPANH